MAKTSLRSTSTPTVEESTAIDVAVELPEDEEQAAVPPQAHRSEPASEPAPAGAVPATMTTAPEPEPAKPRQSTARLASRPDCAIPNDIAMFASRGESYAKEMTREVRAQVILDLRGCIGINCQFDFKRGDVLLLPLWFAQSYPKNLVVKE